jgi:iron-sulfur cluster assembly accessory protein
MLTVTEDALNELKRIADAEGNPLRVRLAMQGGGCSGYKVDMCFTKWQKDDEFDLTFTQDGVEFLVDKKSATLLEGATLGHGGGLLDRGFKWTFPKATGGCGCGTSFSF